MQNKDVPVMYISTEIKKKQADFSFFFKVFSSVCSLTEEKRLYKIKWCKIIMEWEMIK